MGLNIVNELNKDIKIGVIGCGKMASAILSGIANMKILNSKNIYVFDINADLSFQLAEKFGFNIVSSLKELFDNCNAIMFCTKPFVINELLYEIKNYYSSQLLLSILAGVKIEKFENVLNNPRVIRIMPNTPALVNEGMSAICASNLVLDNEISLAENLMKCCGKVIKTTEDKFDVITALSGSGPAFYFKIIELLAKSAQKLGLSEKESQFLSAQTALGSAKMIFNSEFNFEQLIKNVTTPGGCTEVGNRVLLESDLEKIFDKLIKDTMQKAIELG